MHGIGGKSKKLIKLIYFVKLPFVIVVKHKKKKYFFHQTIDFSFILLFIGYANEVGESFRPLIPKKIVNLSYGIAISYVIADCTDKTIKTYRVRTNINSILIRFGLI